MSEEGVRKHCTPGATNPFHFTCNYCGHVTRGGGITRMKLHLSGNDPKKNVKACTSVPSQVRTEMLALQEATVQKKKNKGVLQETVDDHVAGRFGPTHVELDPDQQYERDMMQALKRSRQETQPDACRSGPGGGSGISPPPYFRPDSGRQPTIPEITNPKLKGRLGKDVSSYVIHENIPAAKVKSPHFRHMINEAVAVGKSRVIEFLNYRF